MLQGTTIAFIMSKFSCNTNYAFERLRDIITTYTPHGPLSYRTEEANVEYLKNVLAGVDWTKPALTKS